MNDTLLLEALRELGDRLSAVDVPEGIVSTFACLSDLGIKLFTTVLEQNPAVISRATNCVMRLEPSDLLLECLTAARANEWPRFVILVHEALANKVGSHLILEAIAPPREVDV
jgi:hypothetical protein